MIIKVLVVLFWVSVITGGWRGFSRERSESSFWREGYLSAIAVGAGIGVLCWTVAVTVILGLALSIQALAQ